MPAASVADVVKPKRRLSFSLDTQFFLEIYARWQDGWRTVAQTSLWECSQSQSHGNVLDVCFLKEKKKLQIFYLARIPRLVLIGHIEKFGPQLKLTQLNLWW